METLIITYDDGNRAIRQVLEGLKKMGAISVEKSPYSRRFVRKVARGDKELSQGKGVAIPIEELWK